MKLTKAQTEALEMISTHEVRTFTGSSGNLVLQRFGLPKMIRLATLDALRKRALVTVKSTRTFFPDAIYAITPAGLAAIGRTVE